MTDSRLLRIRVQSTPAGPRYIDGILDDLSANSWSGILAMDGLNEPYDPSMVGVVDPIMAAAGMSNPYVEGSSTFEDREDHTLIDWQAYAGWDPVLGATAISTGATGGGSAAWRCTWWLRYNPVQNRWYKILRPNPNATSNLNSGKGHNYSYNAYNPDTKRHFRIGTDGTISNWGGVAFIEFDLETEQFLRTHPTPSGSYALPQGGTATFNVSSNPGAFTVCPGWGGPRGSLIFFTSVDGGLFWRYDLNLAESQPGNSANWSIHYNGPSFDNHSICVYHQGKDAVFGINRSNDTSGNLPQMVRCNRTRGDGLTCTPPPVNYIQATGAGKLLDLGHPDYLFAFLTSAGDPDNYGKIYAFDIDANGGLGSWFQYGAIPSTIAATYVVPMPDLGAALVCSRPSAGNERVYMYRAF